ncbi:MULTISPECIES: hypothetical protein [Aeromonas]|uniref:Uncharacterized protein n=2 Tax=Aeromonas piscicola TaxID=600645 RepID=A0ABT7QHB1_9GAMM|nr:MULTISPECIES: hypothetical protein [Aeromonas]MDM5133362.1 hypothetical protein [Aeromonas piscicola]
MNKPNQRIGAKSNAHVGRDFELAAKSFFTNEGLSLDTNIKIPIGISGLKKVHAFDLGSLNGKILIECKSHKWTAPNDNVPSAKLTVWNEAMYYFLAAPSDYRKIMFVLRDYSEKRKETLAEYYIRTYRHLIPEGVELWEYDESNMSARRFK